jgi:hypothetical protein
MIIVALIRVTLAPQIGKIQDVPYELFLFQLEGCIAVFMASVSAFRSLFASQGSRAVRKKPQFIWSSRHQFWNRGKDKLESDSTKRTNGLPSIPSATITGLRTFINGGVSDKSSRWDSDETNDDWPLSVQKPEECHSSDKSSGTYNSSGNYTSSGTYNPSGLEV